MIMAREGVRELWWAINRALVPSESPRKQADAIMDRLKSMSQSGAYTALHLRIEDDWVEHCKIWEGDNCMTNTDVLDNVLHIEGVPSDRPIYLATGIPLSKLEVITLLDGACACPSY